MQTKKRRIRNSWYDNKQKRTKGKPAATVPQVKDHRPITIIGTRAGQVVATDRTDSHGKASQIADGWKASGLDVQIIETGEPGRPISAGVPGRLDPSGSILGHPGASI